MQKIVIAATVLALTGCATTYNGPKSNEILSLCMAETRDLYLTGDCFEQKLTRYMPGWREKRNYYEVTMFTDFIRAKGLQVKDGSISEADAYNQVMAYNNRKHVQASSELARQRQANAASSAAMIQAGAIMMTAPPPNYAPPIYTPPYPSDTTINVTPQRSYQFYDSRPYR